MPRPSTTTVGVSLSGVVIQFSNNSDAICHIDCKAASKVSPFEGLCRFSAQESPLVEGRRAGFSSIHTFETAQFRLIAVVSTTLFCRLLLCTVSAEQCQRLPAGDTFPVLEMREEATANFYHRNRFLFCE